MVVARLLMELAFSLPTLLPGKVVIAGLEKALGEFRESMSWRRAVRSLLLEAQRARGCWPNALEAWQFQRVCLRTLQNQISTCLWRLARQKPLCSA